MQEVHIHPKPTTGTALADQAYSRGLLERVARGEIDAAIRIWRPEPALALSRLDALRPGADEARRRARRAGVEPVQRVSGGHAVVLGPGSVCVAFAERTQLYEGTQQRYERMAGALVGAFAALEVDAEQGTLHAEWCPGTWSIRAAGVKLAGLAQRVVKGGAWTDAVVTFDPDPDAASLLTDVYDALELPLDATTLSSLADVRGHRADFDEFAQLLLSALLH